MRIDQAKAAVSSRATGGSLEAKKEQLKRACQDFEALLVSRMLKEMWRYPGASISSGFRTLQEISIEEVSAFLCQSGGIGVWRVLYEQLSGALAGEAR